MKKISDKPKSRDTLQDTLPVLLKTITVMKHKQDSEILTAQRKLRRHGDSMWYPGRDPRTEKGD